jgi:hypothetical protein
LALHFRGIEGLGQLAQGWGCGDSGSSQSRRSLTGQLAAKQKAFVLESGFDLLACLKTAKYLCPFLSLMISSPMTGQRSAILLNLTGPPNTEQYSDPTASFTNRLTRKRSARTLKNQEFPYGVVSLELTSFNQSIGSFIPKKSGNDPQVVKGQKIVVGSCICCHHLGNAGGQLALPSWAEVAAYAASSKDNFRKYLTNPRSMNPQAGMPPYPTFDNDTFNALEAYFKAMMPIE